MNDRFRAFTATPTPNQQSSSGNVSDWFGSFVESGVAGMGELVGITPSSTVQKWRQENPLAAFLSEVGGMAIPYVGWFSATKRVKSFDRAINSIGDINKRPFLAGAAREAARFAPFEAGRVLASQVVGDRDIADMSSEAAINLALGAGIGGALESILSAGSRAVPLASLAPGIDVAAPLQIQQRYLEELKATPNILPENAANIEFKLREFRDLARQESLPPKSRYVGVLEDRPVGGENLSKLFITDTKASTLRRRKFVHGRGNFATRQEWEDYAKNAGLPANFEDYAQFPRVVDFVGKSATQQATVQDRVITNALDSIGDGWHLGREVDDGLFVMAKKVKGTPGRGNPDDSWVIFKTDSPGKFAPKAQRWANIVTGKNAWNPQSLVSKDGGEVYDTLTAFRDKFPLVNYRALSADPKGIANALNKVLPRQTMRGGNELIERLRGAVLEYLTPARLQFAKSPRANWIHNGARAAYDAADNMAQRVLSGALKIDPTRDIFFNTLRGQKGAFGSSSIRGIIETLDDAEIEGLWRVWRDGLQGESLAARVADGSISSKVAGAAEELGKLDDLLWNDLNKTRKAVGDVEVQKRSGHYGLSRQWLGDSRIALRGGDGKVVAVASGFNRRGAQKEAERLKERLNEEGIAATIAEEFQISETAAIPKDLRPEISHRGFLLEQQGVRGFRWDLEPFTRQELLEAYENGVRSRLRYQANLAVNDVFMSDLAKLMKEDPHSYKMLTARLNDLAGVQGPLSQIQNKLADQLLAPMLGQNSASKIVQISNTAMFQLQLAAGKMGFPIANAVTFMQNVVPEVAFITDAAATTKAGRYTYFAASGTQGPVGSVGSINPLTLMKDSFREMRKPSPELNAAIERAINERVIDPRLVEEYIGETATKLTDLRSAMKSPGGFVSWLRAASEFLPAMTERFSRGHAFTVGHMLGRDHLGITDPDTLYRFARQFTENTMYLYSTADRPRLYTTPAGSMFGLFKNWMTNYIGTTLEYTGEGLVHNNWAPLMWQTAGTFAVGGLSATPLYMAADGFSRAFTGNGILQSTYELFNGEDEWIGDGFMYGLPPLLSGGMISIYSQTASPLANPMRDGNMLFSTVHWDRAQYLGRAIGAAWDGWQATGEHPGSNTKVIDNLARALAPVTLYRTMGAAQEGVIKSLASGYPITTDAGVMDRLFYSMGLNPVELDKAYAVADELFRERDARQRHIGRLGQAFADAQLNRDSQSMSRILREAYVAGLDPSSVLRSSQARVAKMTTGMLERNFKPADLNRFMRVLGGSE